MKRIISVSMVVILTVIILLYTQVQSFVPAQEQGQETQQDVCNNTAEENDFGNTEKNGAGNADSDAMQALSRQNTQHIADLAKQWAETVEAAVKEAESRKQNSEPELPDFTQENKEVFDRAVEMLGLSETEAEECFQTLCEDDVFQDGAGQLTAFLTGDFDSNGQRDMAAMIHQYPYYCYGSGCIYIYMNEDEPYCFLDDEFPFYTRFNEMHISGGDLDNDGTVEILIEAAGTGNGGAGDWYGRILKYKDHSLEKTRMLPDNEVYIKVRVIHETGENAYSAYFPEFDETIAFEARECWHDDWQEPTWVGGSMGMFNMHCVEYQGGYAMEASEYLIGEGGNSHVVALAKFIIVWDENGNWNVVRWWVEPVKFDWDLTLTRAVTNFLEMNPRDFESAYGPKIDELYYWGLLYCDKEAWKYDGNQLDPYQAEEDYWEVEDITALRVFESQYKPVYNGMDVVDKIDIKDIMDNQNVMDIQDSHWLMVDVFDDYAVSVYFEERNRTVYVKEISFIRVKMREGKEATEALYRYLEENYYNVRQSLKDEEWIKSPDGTKEVCASEGALPKHPSQIFVRQGWEKPDLVFRIERACSIVGWIDEEHVICDQADMGPILVCVESHEVRQTKTGADDYDSYGADYRLEGEFLIAECMGKEIYRWEIENRDGDVLFCPVRTGQRGAELLPELLHK